MNNTMGSSPNRPTKYRKQLPLNGNNHHYNQLKSERRKIVRKVLFVCVLLLLSSQLFFNANFLEFNESQNKSQIQIFTLISNTSATTFSNQIRSITNEIQIFESKEIAGFLHNNSCYDHPSKLLEVSNEINEFLLENLFKFCYLENFGGIYLDVRSPLLQSLDEFRANFETSSVNKSEFWELAVLDVIAENTVDLTGLIRLKKGSVVARGVVAAIVEGGVRLNEQSLLEQRTSLSQTLYALIDEQITLNNINSRNNSAVTNSKLVAGSSGGWKLLQKECSANCVSKFCCQVMNTNGLPVTILPATTITNAAATITTKDRYKNMPYPYSMNKQAKSNNSVQAVILDSQLESDLPYIATIREEIFESIHQTETLNLFEMLFQTNCLPSDKECSTCLRDKKGADCTKCKDVCKCYCSALCDVEPPAKFVKKHLLVRPPVLSRDSSRLIPRIVHQTWWEQVSDSKYPNMSRLINSWKKSGWDYRFYDDTAAIELLKKHFPPEVLEAYNSIIPGAFKADLFRYCALLIYGGVYADVDVMLESNLDFSTGNDVGFMTVIDEPGAKANRRMCLWNGLLAVAPGHPFLAEVIQLVVNNIRNRFTSVDYDGMLCPSPELSVSHAFDTLFTAGPCILGSAVNKVLGNHMQTQFEDGDIDLVSVKNKNFKKTGSHSNLERIPGRVVMLHQNKTDMGAHRFTWLEENLIVAATDMPDFEDNPTKNKEHYSTTHVKTGIYGLEKLYINNEIANEEIRLFVVDPNDD